MPSQFCKRRWFTGTWSWPLICPTEFCFTINVLPSNNAIGNPSSRQLVLFYISSISYLITYTNLLNNHFCNDLLYNLSFGHLNTHPIIIYPNMDEYPFGQPVIQIMPPLITNKCSYLRVHVIHQI